MLTLYNNDAIFAIALNDKNLPYTDIMKKVSVKQFNHNKQFPQLLLLKIQNAIYRIHILHAEKEQYINKEFSAKKIIRETHSHPVYHVVLYAGARNSFFLNDTFHPSCKGVLAVSSPEELHYFGACETGSSKAIEITFALEEQLHGTLYSLSIHKLLSLITGINLKKVDFPVALEEPLFWKACHILESLLTCLNNHQDSANSFYLELAFIDLISFLLDTIYLRSPFNIETNHDNFKKIKSKIETEYNTTIRIKDLASKTNLSERHFCRIYKKKFGISPIEYQQSLRINTAKTLLISTSMRISEIAEQVGYRNVYQFSRMFKKYCNISPRQYRKHPRNISKF